MKETSLSVVDVETTGLSPSRNKLIEVHVLRQNKNGNIKEYSSLINPGISIPSFITRLTGITNKMVDDAPPLSEVIVDVASFIKKNDVFVGHNASFDYRFLNHAFSEVLGRPMENEALCTLKMARRLVPELGSYKLMHLCDHFNIQQDTYHRAKADVHATKKVLDLLIEKMRTLDITTREQVMKVQKMSLAKARKRLFDR